MQHPCTSIEISLSSSGTSTFSVINSQSKQSQHLLFTSIALNTNFAHDSQLNALMMLAACPIYSKTSTTVSWMEITFSKWLQMVVRRGTSAEFVAMPFTFMWWLCPESCLCELVGCGTVLSCGYMLLSTKDGLLLSSASPYCLCSSLWHCNRLSVVSPIINVGSTGFH